MARIEIYTTMMCGFCHAAKRLLKQKGVDFIEIDVMFKPDRRREMMERAKGDSRVPQIFIGDVHIGGCDELYQLDRQNRLDSMLEGTQ